MKIETERLLLYPISNEEMKIIIEQEADPEMKQAYSEMLQGCIDDSKNRVWYAIWLMELKESQGTIVGDFCFKGIEPDGMVEIGYGLRSGFCKKGYMAEAVKAASKWALNQDGVTRVEAETDPDNLASQKVLDRVGYMATGEIGEEGPRFIFVNEE